MRELAQNGPVSTKGKQVKLLKNIAPRLRIIALALVALLCMVTGAQAQTDALDIADNAEAAFNTIAPIMVTIATFFVVLAIVKRVRRA